MSYHQFTNDETGEAYGSFEVFAVSPMEVAYNRQNADHANEHTVFEAGWYWWPCFPDCLPDGDPIGPFDSEQQATTDAIGEAS